jgi:hypothetical protein
MFKLITKNINNKIDTKLMKKYQTTVNHLVQRINLRLLDGSEMMGWVDLIESYDNREILAMRNKANE